MTARDRLLKVETCGRQSSPDNPTIGYGAGDTDHFAGAIVCTDNATGAVTALLDVTTDLVAT